MSNVVEIKSLNEIKVFCENYRQEQLRLNNADVSELDEWVTWGGRTLNLFGSYWGYSLDGNKQALSVEVYTCNYPDEQEDPLHAFNLVG